MDLKISEILKLDVKSEEFFDVYKKLSDKYWTFENPDDLQMAAKNLYMFATRFDGEYVILCHKIIEQLLKMKKEKSKAVTGYCVFEDQQYYFDIYETEVEKDSLDNMIRSVGSSMKKGKVRLKDQ